MPFPEFKPHEGRDYLHTVIQTIETQTNTTGAILFSLARIRGQLGESEEAERWARKAMLQGPKRSDVQLFLAEMFIKQDRMEEAARFLRGALELQSEFPGAQCSLGMVLDRLGDRKGAKKAFQTAIWQAPKDALPRLLLGRLLSDDGQAQDAVRILQEACQLDPKLAGAFYALSQAQSQIGEAASAQESMATFHALKRQEKAELDSRNSSYDDEKFMRALTAGFHRETAGLYLRQNQSALAEAHLRQSVRIAPADPLAHEALAHLLVGAGRLREARSEYEALVVLRSERAAYWVNLGILQSELKEYGAAEKSMGRALELDSKQTVAMFHLARCYLSTRTELPKALQISQQLVALAPTAAHYDLLGWAFYANGQTNAALAATSQAVERDPTNTVYRQRQRRLHPPP